MRARAKANLKRERTKWRSVILMAIHRLPKSRPRPNSLLLLASLFASVILVSFVLSSWNSSPRAYLNSLSYPRRTEEWGRYLYWGDRVDCPGKHCDRCEGLGHQESSLRCALEEAMVLGSGFLFLLKIIKDKHFLTWVFVMPSRMCISAAHNTKAILHKASNTSSEDRWPGDYCSMESLYDLELISKIVPVILDSSKRWFHVLTTSTKLGERGVVHVKGVSRTQLRDDRRYANALLINHTASPLSWFSECRDRYNRSTVMLPYSFLPSMAAKQLRDAADQIKAMLGDYDAIHVRRGDRLKTRKDRFGVTRTLTPHLDRDTRPEAILKRIEKWVSPGRTIFIASNERTPGFFSPLSVRYRLAYASNFSSILDPIVENNYHLFMIERLILSGAKTFIKTFKEFETDLTLTDDPKKNTKHWQIPVYTFDEIPH